MNIFKQLILRDNPSNFSGDMKKIISEFENYDDYDDYIIKEVNKIPQSDFIEWMYKEIDMKINSYKASLIDRHIFQNITMYYDDKIDSIEIKNRLKALAEFSLNNYKDSNKLALWGLKKFKKEYLED